uniref:Uncharacterized protein n=1 Tax=Oryza sativa subsp. japonica TaxID=39947 RepID=Q5Z6M8_ORYSJ|nr:hypothetical protein [Oryza sativa Japonica Group]BAD54391.1 hypothetical protein [Oryza sativa Japonica Group]
MDDVAAEELGGGDAIDNGDDVRPRHDPQQHVHRNLNLIRGRMVDSGDYALHHVADTLHRFASDEHDQR